MDRSKLRQLVDFQFNEGVKGQWYLLAIAVLTSANAPQDIPQVYILELLRSLPEYKGKDVDLLLAKVDELLMDKDLLNKTFQDAHQDQREVLDKINETVLKVGVIVGIPRSINALKYVKSWTPDSLLIHANQGSRDKCYIRDEQVKRKEMGTKHNLERGLIHWERTYGKVSQRIIQDLNSFYPDLWQFIVKNVYGDILSYDSIVDGPTTSLAVISSLIPMDVNPQLRGHLRSALNFGWTVSTINQVRQFAILISTWYGIQWRSEITKL
ncbi:peroxisomal protein 2 [Monosporozyma servazzii]